MKKILFIYPYPAGVAPSQRFRFEQYIDDLPKEEFTIRKAAFMDAKTWAILYKSGNYFRKAWGILWGFVKRWALMFTLGKYHFVFIHREAAPIGYPLFEWIIAKVWRKKIIYDFDDAIWLPNTSVQNALVAKIKFHQKTALICQWAHKVSVGNEYLGNYARQFNPHVVYNPTTIDTQHLHNHTKDQTQETLVIGWTGSHSTLPYLKGLEPIIRDLETRYEFEFWVIANQAPMLNLKSLVYVPWNKATEIDDLLHFNIGVMPLTNDQWAKGKCGFKALQYMALGVPPLVSPVGVNTRIVQDGVNGFVCDSPQEWQEALEKLLKSSELRTMLGQAARHHVEQHYSVKSNQNNFRLFFSL
ncbi:glycosyltransferase family 4 protein [Microscilla marina]|uniref:Glycosyl transferase, group 1 family protein n=1 Tax=Microscilla marina ATCC 23134 TaxID=313606 RepID=A1ZTP9_MICM2|nr:glycosyltransferase family 4 protein [Microscilla marina]EAY26309.1 glycosyl transferase, group 1 family protein [Microscilla marina ATCC 23134]